MLETKSLKKLIFQSFRAISLKKIWIFLFQLNTFNIFFNKSTKTHMNLYCMGHTGPACRFLNTVQIRTTFHSYPRHAPSWHGPPERGSFYRRALSRARGHAPAPICCGCTMRLFLPSVQINRFLLNGGFFLSNSPFHGGWKRVEFFLYSAWNEATSIVQIPMSTFRSVAS